MNSAKDLWQRAWYACQQIRNAPDINGSIRQRYAKKIHTQNDYVISSNVFCKEYNLINTVLPRLPLLNRHILCATDDPRFSQRRDGAVSDLRRPGTPAELTAVSWLGVWWLLVGREIWPANSRKERDCGLTRYSYFVFKGHGSVRRLTSAHIWTFCTYRWHILYCSPCTYYTH